MKEKLSRNRIREAVRAVIKKRNVVQNETAVKIAQNDREVIELAGKWIEREKELAELRRSRDHLLGEKQGLAARRDATDRKDTAKREELDLAIRTAEQEIKRIDAELQKGSVDQVETNEDLDKKLDAGGKLLS